MSTLHNTCPADADQLRLIPDDYATMDIRDIPLVELPPNDDLVGDSPDSQFINNVKQFGVMSPIVVFEQGNGAFRVGAGRRRIKAARAAGFATIPTRVYQQGWVNPHIITIVENRQRGRNRAADLDAVDAMLAEGYDERDICDATGMRLHELRAVLRLRALCPELRAALRDGAIRVSHAEAAARKSPEDQQRLAQTLKETGKLGHRDIAMLGHATTVNVMATLPLGLNEPTLWQDTVALLARQILQQLPTDDPAAVHARYFVQNFLAELDEQPALV